MKNTEPGYETEEDRKRQTRALETFARHKNWELEETSSREKSALDAVLWLDGVPVAYAENKGHKGYFDASTRFILSVKKFHYMTEARLLGLEIRSENRTLPPLPVYLIYAVERKNMIAFTEIGEIEGHCKWEQDRRNRPGNTRDREPLVFIGQHSLEKVPYHDVKEQSPPMLQKALF